MCKAIEGRMEGHGRTHGSDMEGRDRDLQVWHTRIEASKGDAEVGVLPLGIHTGWPRAVDLRLAVART